MNKFPWILGINHQFIYPEGISNPRAHMETLIKLCEDERFDALDCWVTAGFPYRRREIDILRTSKKVINYNIGDRFGEKICRYAAIDADDKCYAHEIFRREADMALESGAKKIIMASGPDDSNHHLDSIQALIEFMCEECERLPKDVTVELEPTDRDIDKKFLLGTLEDTIYVVKKVNERIDHNHVGVLLDMGHIPLMRETIKSAVEKTAAYIDHVHLGNCFLADRSHPLYGDKHVPWCFTGGKYGENDVEEMLGELQSADYFTNSSATVSFEMRPYAALGAEKSIQTFLNILEQAWLHTYQKVGRM